MSSMALNIVKDVTNYNRNTGNYDLMITTGEAISKMFVRDDNLEDKALYLLYSEREQDGIKVRSYYKLDFSENETKPTIN